MTSTSKSLGDDVEPEATLGVRLKKMRDEAGLTQQTLTDELKKHGIDVSASTVSRWENDGKLPDEKVLRAICEACQQSRHYEKLHGLLPPKQVTTSQPKFHTWITKVLAFDRRNVATFLVGIVAVTALFFSIRPWLGSKTNPGSGGTEGVSRSSQQSTPPCQQYAVASYDLWLRGEYGETLIQLPHNQKVTVIDTRNPHGLDYWQVTTEGGRKGWISPGYLKPLC